MCIMYIMDSENSFDDQGLNWEKATQYALFFPVQFCELSLCHLSSTCPLLCHQIDPGTCSSNVLNLLHVSHIDVQQLLCCTNPRAYFEDECQKGERVSNHLLP